MSKPQTIERRTQQPTEDTGGSMKEHNVIFRTASGTAWRILGGLMTRERAYEVAAQAKKHDPRSEWNIKPTWAKFPGAV